MHIFMALSSKFEHLYASFLHRDPFPTMEIIVAELLFERTRLATLKFKQPVTTINTVLVTFSRLISSRHCHQTGHDISVCPNC